MIVRKSRGLFTDSTLKKKKKVGDTKITRYTESTKLVKFTTTEDLGV